MIDIIVLFKNCSVKKKTNKHVAKRIVHNSSIRDSVYHPLVISSEGVKRGGNRE